MLGAWGIAGECSRRSCCSCAGLTQVALFAVVRRRDAGLVRAPEWDKCRAHVAERLLGETVDRDGVGTGGACAGSAGRGTAAQMGIA